MLKSDYLAGQAEEIEKIITTYASKLYALYKIAYEHPKELEVFQNALIASIQRCKAEIMEPIFVFNDSKDIVGFCICCFDKKIQFTKESSAFFTYILLVNDRNVVQELIRMIRIFMQKRSISKIIGPIHDSIVFERGLRTFDSLMSFTGMPTHKSYVLDILLDAKFIKEHDMIEIIYKNPALQRRIVRLAPLLKRRFEKTMVEVVDGNGIFERSAEVAEFYNNEWKHNWGFQPIDKRDIQAFCKSIPTCKNNAVFIYFNKKLIGFCMMLEEVNSELARVYFIGTARSFRNIGIPVYMLLILGTEIIMSKGIKLISCGWMLESNALVLTLVRKFISTQDVEERRYRILSLKN